jgi:hypothetical protein
LGYAYTSHSLRIFIVRKGLRALTFYVVKEALEVYTATSPHGGWYNNEHTTPVLGIAKLPLVDQFKWTWIHIFFGYASLEMANSMYGVVSVLLNRATPQECPSAFGDLRDLVTVRKAWAWVLT